VNVQPAPQFTLDHVEGHPVSLSDYRGRTVVVAMSDRHSAEEMVAGIDALRAHYDHDQLPILAVADMKGIPRPARVMAKKQMKKGFQEAVEKESTRLQAAGKQVPEGSQLVVMLPDWDGQVADSFGIADTDQASAFVLIDTEGNVRGYGRGAEAPQQIMGLFG
jgi:cytochrome oxidase Cu insertion factor (SCO1/SenC/PrrC family)